METNFDVVIIGGGASGMMASVFAGQNGNKVLLLDHNEKLGKKIYITGKGKCNLTNNSSIEEHLKHIVTNSKFMMSCLHNFSAQDTISFFESRGMETRTERGNRVFPKSNKASDVTKTLEKAMHDAGVKISLSTTISKITKTNEIFNILCESGIIYTTNNLIIATGGLSYSGTGATKFGHEIAKSFGHTIIKPKSALCPILVKDDISTLNGLTLRNVTLTIEEDGKSLKEFGDLLFTFNSLTGPIALTLSSLINKWKLKNAKAYIDLKPALTNEQLEAKFKREFVEFSKKDLKNYLHTLLPASLVEFFFAKLGIENKKVAELSKVDRNKLISMLKKFDFLVQELDNINVSIVTSGGVCVDEINPKTCESKLVKNLFFVGEVLDVDALTGGFNLQIAWSTGYAAGNSIKGN